MRVILKKEIEMDEKQKEMYLLIESHYREQFERLVKVYTRYLGSKERAEDVIQEAYTRALAYYSSYDRARDFNKWFNSIIAAALRDNKRATIMHGMVDISEAEDVPVKASAIPSIMLDRVLQRINTKPEQEANVLKLALVQQYRPSEISSLVELSSGAIRMIVHRFRQEIKDEYRWVV
jgi:RNA polymerase sigma factor (sigma-70 family)